MTAANVRPSCDGVRMRLAACNDIEFTQIECLSCGCSMHTLCSSAESCPHGDDPTTTGQVDEVQLLKCTATGGTFQLRYRTGAAVDVPFDATPSNLRDILLSMFGFSDVAVLYSLGSSACSPATTPATNQNVVSITFTDDPGNLPALRVDTTSLTLGASQRGTVVVAVDGAPIDTFASRAGTKENDLCSHKGTCNYGTGQCQCAAGYGSSDGRGGLGTRGDCGFILPMVAKAVL